MDATRDRSLLPTPCYIRLLLTSVVPGNFRPNIAKSVPFADRKFTWSVPANFRPGRSSVSCVHIRLFRAGGYWIAVRCIPFDVTGMEGAGPPGAAMHYTSDSLALCMLAYSFKVEQDPDAPPAPPVQVSGECTWELRDYGEWKDLAIGFPGLPDLLTAGYEAGKSSEPGHCVLRAHCRRKRGCVFNGDAAWWMHAHDCAP